MAMALSSAALSAAAGKPAPKKAQCVKKATTAKTAATKSAGKQNPVVKKPTQPPKPNDAVTGKTTAKPSPATAGRAGSGPPAGSTEVVKPVEAKIEAVSADACTSLVVDATGLKLDKCMSPKLVRQDGTIVWGTFTKLTDEQYSILEERGMAAYVATVEEARSNSRAGSRPLLLKAVASTGAGMKSDLVISDADAQQLLAENAKGKFLDDFNVILVRNENPPPADESAQPPPAEGEPGEPQH